MRLSIERMTYGPDAIAHTEDGKCVFVSGAIAGDVVEAELVSDGKSFAKAKVTEVLEPSPVRVTPTWPLATVLGCAPWACMEREAQLAAKRANVVDALARVGHMATKKTRPKGRAQMQPNTGLHLKQVAHATDGDDVVCHLRTHL